jgi:hypothetical protein
VYYAAAKNITITLDEQTAEWAREAAAKQGKSLSRFVSDSLRAQLPKPLSYERSMNSFLSRQPWQLRARGEKLATREEVHDHGLFRRR